MWNVFIDSFSQQIVDAVQSLSCVRLFVTPWTAALQASLTFTISRSLLKVMSVEWCHPTISSSIIPFSSCLQSFSASGSFLMSWFFTSDGQSIGASTLALVLPMNIQDWFPLKLTGLTFLQSKGLKNLYQHHSWKASILWCAQPSLWSIVLSGGDKMMGKTKHAKSLHWWGFHCSREVHYKRNKMTIFYSVYSSKKNKQGNGIVRRVLF